MGAIIKNKDTKLIDKVIFEVELEEFAKKHERFTARTFKKHLLRVGYTHYYGRSCRGKIFKKEIDESLIISEPYKNLQKKGIISRDNYRTWDSLIFKG